MGWKDEFELRDDLVQRDVYPFEAALQRHGGLTRNGSAMNAEHALRAAIEAGWVKSPETETGERQ